jgi:hypothetical protein
MYIRKTVNTDGQDEECGRRMDRTDQKFESGPNFGDATDPRQDLQLHKKLLKIK